MKKTARLDDAETIGSILRLGAEMADDFSTHLGGKAGDYSERGPAFSPKTEVRWALDDADSRRAEQGKGASVVGETTPITRV